MQFVNPYFLFGLLAVSIPIIIHLFNFRRYKKVYFTNVSDLKDLKHQTRKKSQLKHLIVLLLRILAIICLVLAFAQPYIPVKGNLSDLNKRKAISVYIDNSYSMEAMSDDMTLLEQAKINAISVAGVYKESDLFNLITNDFEGRHQRMLSKDEFIDMVEEIEATPIVRTLSGIYDRQTAILKEHNKDNRLIYYFSDFQKNSSDFNKIEQDSLLTIYLVPVIAVLKNNLYIDSCWFETPVQQINQDVRLKVRIINKSDTDFEKIPVKLLINNVQKGVASFDIKAGSEAEVEIPYTNYYSGIQFGNLSIVDYPITFDDHFYLSYSILASIPVLCINQEDSNPYLNAVFGKDSTFMFENAKVSNLDYSTFNSYNLIILNDISEISSGLAQELKKFLDEGGNIVIFPSAELDLNNYQMFASVTNSGYYGEMDTAGIRTSEININNKLFNDVFESIPRNIDLPDVHSYFPIIVPSRINHEVLLKLQNDNIFLNVQPVGKGLIYMFSVPLDPIYSNLPRHAIFVPALYKMALLSEPAGKLFYTLGKDPFIEMRMVQLNGDMVFKFKGTQEEFEIIPEFRNTGAKTNIYTHDQIKKAGNYILTAGESEIVGISFNYDREESNLSSYSPEELTELINNLNLINYSVISESNKTFSDVIEDLSIGKRFWKWFVVIVILCLAGEIASLRVWR